MACQSVARPAGNDAQGRVRLHNGPPNLVNGTIAANGHRHIYTLLFGLGGNVASMSGILGGSYFVVEKFLVAVSINSFGTAFLTSLP